ncbi:serine hydrolase domain-containing protein [Microscilla marina]|uniref:Beta-lactamase, putative n=1 Tax=Microscilla marina ATCC 23134 TaxID=313606 RepID=A1ZZY0_MICM2|nr:serine hydrolase domain-containing protein [Microscilla marina]EAY24068.1 beta-lactamase, putative [Microscilla marina ATCC 23134]
MINRLFLCSLALMLWVGAARAQTKQSYNLDMEQLNAQTKLPKGWRVNKRARGYAARLDSQIVKQGKYSLFIDAFNARFGACRYALPLKYRGQVVELKGYMKTKNVAKSGFAGLWMRIDGKNHSVAFDNLRSQKITGTNDWKEYSIQLPLFAKAEQIVVGGLVVGKGQIWIDDLRLYIDGKPIDQAPFREKGLNTYGKNYDEVSAKEIRKNLLKSWKVVKQALSKYHQQQGLKYGASLSLVMDGKLYDDLQLGYADREAKRKINARQIHQWASVSKTFTATAILQLAEQGKLKLSDPVTKYIPALGTVKDPEGKSSFHEVKLHHLITHSAHFRRDAIYDTVLKLNPNYPYQNTHCFEDWMKYKHLFKFKGKPGKKYRYSNWGYSYLGMVIEKASGMKFKDYVKKYIFEPLNMQDAFFSSPTTTGHRRRMAACYEEQGNGKAKRYKPTHDQCFEEANGGLKATVSDMVKWMNFYSQTATGKAERQRHAQVLKPATVKKYFSVPGFAKQTPTYNADSLRLKSENWIYTQSRVAGFHANQVKSNQSVQLGHTGGQYHYISYMFWHPKGNFGIICTRNTEAYSGTSAKVFEVMLDYYYHELLEVTNKALKR